jgi:pimeloyl-ACP methyl ester carboxylesterase
MSMAELADEHADAIRSLGDGPIEVVGVSTGGSIAEQVAADHSDVVDRLLLLSTGCPRGPEGPSAAAPRCYPHPARRPTAGVRREGGGRRSAQSRRLAVATLAWLAGPRVLAGGDDLADMATTIEAEDAFDLAACPSPIRAPTVILAGRVDRFCGPELCSPRPRD